MFISFSLVSGLSRPNEARWEDTAAGGWRHRQQWQEKREEEDWLVCFYLPSDDSVAKGLRDSFGLGVDLQLVVDVAHVKMNRME